MFPTYLGVLENSSTPYRSGIQYLIDGIPLLSWFILTAEWSLTHVTLATIRLYFRNCLKPAHKSWGRTRLACRLTDGATGIAANPRSRPARESRAPPGPMILQSGALLEVNGRRRTCFVNTGGGVRLVNQRSGSACIRALFPP
jgi:hypothetical protein